MNIIMISGNNTTVVGKRDSFFEMLEEYSKYWDRIDVIGVPVQDKLAKKLTSVHGNVYFHVCSGPKIMLPQQIQRIGLDLTAQRKYDLISIHEYAPFLLGFGGVALAKKTKIPFVSEFHHIEGYPAASNVIEWLRRIMAQIYVRWVAKRALRLRVINKVETPNFMLKNGVPKEKLIYLHSFHLKLEDFRPQGVEKKYEVVYCGRLATNKGLKILLDAFYKLQMRLPAARLLLIGTGPLEQDLKHFVQEHRLEKNVVFWGWAKDTVEIASLYNQSKVFVLASFAEGGPKTPLEAMACRLPVISTRVGIMNEVIRSGENGFLVSWDANEMAERMYQVLTDKALSDRLANAGCQDIQESFDRKVVVKNYALGYQKLVQENR